MGRRPGRVPGSVPAGPAALVGIVLFPTAVESLQKPL